MKNCFHRLVILIAVGIFVYPIAVFSNQEIDFSNESTVAELIAGKTWRCKMVDAYGESTGEYAFKSVKGNKVKGTLRVPHIPVCDSDVLKGKLKNNRLKYRAPNGTACREVNGMLEFGYNHKGELEAMGSYSIGGTHKRGTYVCSIMK